MIPPTVPLNEDQRLSALQEFAILDTAHEEDFDKLARLVATACATPIALISFIDSEREWFKATVGLPVDNLPRSVSFCAHALTKCEELLIVPDALADERFVDNPIVVGPPFVRSYAGAPLVTADGYMIGRVCVIDHEPRTFSAKQVWLLEHAAFYVMTLLEQRRVYRELVDSLDSGASAEPVGIPLFIGRRHVRAPALIGSVQRDGLADLPIDVVQAVPGIFYLFDASGEHLLWNNRLEEVTGYRGDEIAQITPLQLIAARDRPYVADRIRHAFEQGSASADVMLVTSSGEEKPFYLTAQIVSYRGRLCLAGVGIDISDRKHAETELKRAALEDPLTGLGNRRVLLDRLAQSPRIIAQTGEQTTVFFIDLDRFKAINDILGHSGGDELLKSVAGRVRRSVRADDIVTRLGGDEFVVVARTAGANDIEALVRNLRAVFHRPFSVKGRLFHITASVGVSVFPVDGVDPEDLLKNADAAMYRAKNDGRDAIQFYTSDMHVTNGNRLMVEADLRRAVEDDQFELFYQPVIDLRSGATISAEALIRWHHPDRGLLLPAEFISIAEQTRQINRIGAWVLRTAAQQSRRLSALGVEDFSISVNVSGQQLEDAGFVTNVRNCLEAGTIPATLGIEITESAALTDVEHVLNTLNICRRLGLLVLLDDFGTHYSSLTYLQKFPIDVLKIDKSFIDGIPESANDCSIVRAIIALGRGSRRMVIAEGVESTSQVDWLSANGCFLTTGFLFARPMPAAQLEMWLQTSRKP